MKQNTEQKKENFFKRNWNSFAKRLGKSKRVVTGTIGILCLVILIMSVIIGKKRISSNAIDPELARAMKYEQFKEEDENVDGTDNVKFSAFFLRDINGDGYAEKIKGTAKRIDSTDNLYMELKVQSEGYLKEAEIQIDGKNFNLQTSLVKDEQLKDNYISNNTKNIMFNDLTNGTQKLIEGKIKSAIGQDTNNYTRDDNKIILTGIYVGADNVEKQIRKEINLAIDWYGITCATINLEVQNYEDTENKINEDKNTFSLDFKIQTEETEKQLILSKNYVEGIIPDLNGYKPLQVIQTFGEGDFKYDETTKQFTITKNGTLADINTYKINVEYPLEAYRRITGDTITLKIPVKTYYEGYNNPNAEFQNPYKSNIYESTIIVNYAEFPEDGTLAKVALNVEKSLYREMNTNVISKHKPIKIYNGESAEEKGDTYRVKWKIYTGPDENQSGAILKETQNNQEQISDEFIKTDGTADSMENITTNVGISFFGPNMFLGKDGWIKIYDDETGNLIETFTSKNWNDYTVDKPYMYTTPVKHIRIETSTSNKNSYMYFYCIKELNDEFITTHYTKDEFDKLQYISSTLTGYLGGKYINTAVNQGSYEAEYSQANITMKNRNNNEDSNTLTTQITDKNKRIMIKTGYDPKYNQIGWINGSFLIKLPKGIVTAQVNDIQIDNSKVSLVNYELTKQDGINFIKINTKNDEQEQYNIMIDVDLTPDPRLSTSTENIELYASNGIMCDYQPKAQDLYDVNDNLNTTEMVANDKQEIKFIAPNSLITNQTISNYDNKGNTVVSPEIADIKPNYANVDNEERKAKIGVQIKNNSLYPLSEVTILGKIPFKGNTYVLSGEDLGSTYTTKMANTGIEIPQELQGKVTVYYSENETPDKELDKVENGWKTAEQIGDWDKIKTYLINFGETNVNYGTEYVFYYMVQIPSGLSFNNVSYSHHGVYFYMNTPEGKYKTETEPSKIGLRIAEKYDLELTKFQAQTDKVVSGATYSVKEVIGDVVSKEGKKAVTNEQGQITIKGLYAEKVYEIEEIKAPEQYELNTDKVRYTTKVDENGILKVEKMQGTTKEELAVTKNEGQDYKIMAKVEDEAKGKLKIVKTEKGTENKLRWVYYKITGAGLPENGQTLITDVNGEVTLNGLSINEEYTLQEIKATGYYLASQIKFKIINNNGNYEVEIIEGETKESSVIEEQHIPTVNLKLEDEKIPTYDLEITKVRKNTSVSTSTEQNVQENKNKEDIEALAGARFRLYANNQEIGNYITNAEGKIQINALYENATYTLKETVAPTGYSKVKDITFKVEQKDGKLEFKETTNSTSMKYTVEGNTLKLQIEDSPIFKIIKKDGETNQVIANTKFAIYNMQNESEPATNSKGEILGSKETINGKEYYTLTTNEKGEITADLQEGEYKAIEIQAPKQYQVSDKAYYFAIGSLTANTGLKAEKGITVGEGKYNSNFQVIETEDNGYLVNNDGILIKYNHDFEEQWRRDIGKPLRYYASNNSLVTEIKLGDYITHSSNKIIKVGSNGEIKWEKIAEETSIYAIAGTKDEGFMIGGMKGSDGFIAKYNNNGEEQWNKMIEASSALWITKIKETKDDGFIIGGQFYNGTINLGEEKILDNRGGEDIMIAKYNSEGKAQWGKVIGGNGEDVINSLIETKDGNILVGGYYNRESIDLGNGVILNEPIGRCGMIIKYNSQGEAQWTDSTEDDRDCSYESYAHFDDICSLIETNDGGYMAVGYVSKGYMLNNGQVLNAGGYDTGIIIKYNVNGKVQFAKSINEPRNGGVFLKSFIQTNNGDYIIGGALTGYNSSLNLENGQSLKEGSALIEYKTTDIQNTKIKEGEVIGGSLEDQIETIINTQDGGYIVGGHFSGNIALGNGNILNSNGTNGIIIKYNNNGIVQWSRTMSGSNIISILETEEGDYIVGGYCKNQTLELENGNMINLDNTYDNGILIKYTKDGVLKWVKSIGGAIYQISETKDKGCLIAGTYRHGQNLGNGIKLEDNNANYQGMIVKCDKDGNAEWAKSIKSEGGGALTSVQETQDEGYIIGGVFREKAVDFGNNIILNKEEHGEEAILVKYDKNGKAEWGREYTSYYYDKIENSSSNWKSGIRTIIEESNGDYVIGGAYTGNSVDLGNGIHLETSNRATAILVKYNSEGQTKWAKQIRGNWLSGDSYINSVKKTQDGGYIVSGEFAFPKADLGNGVVLDNNIDNNRKFDRLEGLIVKYDNNGEAKWAKSIGGTYHDAINAVIETDFGNYIAVGAFASGTIKLENGQTLVNKGSTDAMILKLEEQMAGSEELEILNTRKEFKITTDIEEMGGIKGGNISGEGEKPYEIVKYGDSNTKEIRMIPDENYELIKITVNGQNYSFEKATDGSYIMPAFKDITEDKNIVVTYALRDSKVTINKVDSVTNAPLEGAEFKVQQDITIENVVGNLTQNNVQDTTILSAMNRMGQFYFEKENGGYTSTNNITYQQAHDMKGAPEDIITNAIANKTANSMMIVDLSGKTGKYTIEVNAAISSEEGKDIGYAVLSETSTPPTYDNPEGRFIYLSGEIEAQDYTYELQAGKRYFLHFGYRKDESGNVGEDRMIINSVKCYKPTYSFVEKDGKYELNQEDISKNSYLPIDLRDKQGEFTINVNAEITGEENRNIGYVAITESTTSPDYENEPGTFVNIVGNKEATDYTATILGGKMYYLHLGYAKRGNIPIENCNFIINNIKIALRQYTVVTNKDGKGSLQLPFGKYKITETKAPEGYLLNKEPIDFEFTSSGTKELTVPNTKSSKVIVHHYVKGTTEKLVEDEQIEGKEGEPYTTAPKMDIEKYTLDANEEGNYIVPENASGRYRKEGIEVTYEYVKKDIPLTVHHYIEDTNHKVPLANGELAEDVIQKGKEGEAYTTSAIPENELKAEYELAKTPENSTGIYNGKEMSITYYYKKVQRKITLAKYEEDGITPLAGAKFTIQAKTNGTEEADTIYVTDKEGKIQTTLAYGEYDITEIEAPEGYVLPEEPTTQLNISKDLEDKEIKITNEKEKGTVIVHYYIEGTTSKVPLTDGNVAEDIIKTGLPGEIYATKEAENVSKRYELVAEPENASGLITKDTIVVNYFYRTKEESTIDNSELTKESTKESIKKADEKIPYTIMYTGEIDKYKGNAVVTITDKLPYEIDIAEGKSDLAGGTYDRENKTITWVENIEGIDTFTNGKKQINITKTIQVTYKDIDLKQATLSNGVTGKIDLKDTETTITDTTEEELPIDTSKDINISLVWIDTEEQRQKRPEKLMIQVKRDDKIVDSKEITVNKQQAESKIEFKDLPKYDDEGNEIHYTVDEAVLSGEQHKEDLKFYEKTIDGFTITNRFVVPKEKISIRVNKVWVDQDDFYKKRPTSLVLQIKKADTGEVVQNGEIEVATENSYTFTQLEQYDSNGKEIVYTADEKEMYQDELINYEKEIGKLTDITDVSTNTETVPQKEITITNTMNKTPGTVVVRYIDKYTKEEVSDSVEKTGIVGDRFDISADKKDIVGYTLVEEPTEKTGQYTEDMQRKTYYYAKNTKVVVKYLEKSTNSIVSEKEQYEINGYEGKSYTTELKSIAGYVNIETTGKTSGAMTREESEVIYYYAKSAKVNIKYVEQFTNTILAEETLNGYVGKEYQTDPKEIAGYTFVKSTDNTQGIMKDEKIEIIYYYAKGTKVVVKHLEKDTKKQLAEEETINGYVGQEYVTQKKEITGYTFVESTNNTKGKMTEKAIEVIYYYAQQAKVTVQHIDKNTSKILKTVTQKGEVGEAFVTCAENIEGYVLVESPKSPNGTFSKTEQIIRYYYARISSGVIEKHIDINTQQLLYSETHYGKVGDKYNMVARTFEGYDLSSKSPSNVEGEMKKDIIEVKFYYSKKASVKVSYIYKTTGEKIAEDIEIYGHENDDYKTEKKEIKGYGLMEVPNNATGKMKITRNPDGTYNTQTLVQYYYNKKSEGVIEKYVDITTGKVIEEIKHEGNVNDKYEIVPKEIEDYELVIKDENGNSKLPTNNKGTMEEKVTTVTYYYVRKTKVVVKYIDKQTNRELEQEEIQGYEGDSYETKEKQFDGYGLLETPKNAKGKMKANTIEVRYYYKRKAQVEIQYLEKETNNILSEKQIINGYVGDKYKIQRKDVPYYEFVEGMGNSEGTMTKDKIMIKYYFEKQVFNLKVDTWVSNVKMNGVSQGGKTLSNKNEIYKLDINRKKVNTSEIKITYKIRISNSGEIEGTVSSLTDIIPNGYKYYPEDNKINWKDTDGILTTTDLKNEIIKPGENKEIELVLRWIKGEDNFGEKTNTVSLTEITNPAGYKDIDKEDNIDRANMIIMIATGMDTNDRTIIKTVLVSFISVLAIFGALVFYKKKSGYYI